ncbi:uncharacterized protein LOC126787410 isoform X2 [Argentina anserina]|uniref:uncharacterized protein LOC126787410 isoform X2 n=1 Tax=Argentina anserina TaxID=57926 RepID=UPI0021763038|nr:uncharacterized protein LOC126787410 isoform X2 [Potentilla anserina]
MPGSVLVSVLEFMDLPSSSSSSSISIKVSLGPRSEYQIWESRDLSFPLTTLRDNMLIILQDSEGNQILETGIETRSIVEKGLWDDFFPLKGGGFLHMKLQFVLSEEERNQIRMMRESAVKKKHGEFIHSSSTSVQSTPSARTSVVSTLSLRNVISDRSEETSPAITVQQSVNMFPTELSRGGLVDNIDAQPRPANISAKAICPDEPVRLLRGSQSVVGTTTLPKLQEENHCEPEKQQSPLKRSRSVKNMISAFETGLTEDKKPHIKPAPMKVQSNKNIKGHLLKEQHLKEYKKVSTKTPESISKRVVNSLPPGQLQRDTTYGESSEQNTSLGALDFSATSSEAVKSTERVLDDHGHQPTKMLHGKRVSGGSPVIVESHQPEISFGSSQKSNIPEVAAQICTPLANCEDRHNSFQGSGGWMFPDEALRFCITTNCKKVMEFLGSCNMMKPDMHQDRKSLSPPKKAEDQQDNLDSEYSNQVNRTDKNHRPKEVHKVKKSEETETSGVAVGQALKVGIMVGFGTLVLLTRQGKNR